MDTTKLQICNAAKELFNEHGYCSVSMRDIASAAGISLGTLTYHFSRKEDLLGAIMDLNILTFPDAPPENIVGLHDLLRQMLVSIEEAPFYFNDYSVYTALPTLRDQHHAHVGKLFALMEQTLSRLAKQGLLNRKLLDQGLDACENPVCRLPEHEAASLPAISPSLTALTRLLLLSHTGWSQYNHTRDISRQIPLEEILAAQWLAIVPYLTEAGLKQYQELTNKSAASS